MIMFSQMENSIASHTKHHTRFVAHQQVHMNPQEHSQATGPGECVPTLLLLAQSMCTTPLVPEIVHLFDGWLFPWLFGGKVLLCGWALSSQSTSLRPHCTCLLHLIFFLHLPHSSVLLTSPCLSPPLDLFLAPEHVQEFCQGS